MPPAFRRIVFVAFAATLAVTGCSNGNDEAKKEPAETSSEEFTRAAVTLDVTRAELVSPHKALGPLEKSTREAVRAVIERLLLVTSAGPLTEGKAGSGFADLFTPDAGARAANNDREVFFDEGLPRFGELRRHEARLGITGLAETTKPDTAFVIAKYVWDVGSVSRPNDRIVRTGEVSLIPVGGEWKIGAYTIVVTRTIDDATTTTTAKSK